MEIFYSVFCVSRGGCAGKAGAGTGLGRALPGGPRAIGPIARSRHVSDFLSGKSSVVAKSPLTVRIDLPCGPRRPGGPIDLHRQSDWISGFLKCGVEYAHHKEKTTIIHMVANMSRR
jgi:hypothetical protein